MRQLRESLSIPSPHPARYPVGDRGHWGAGPFGNEVLPCVSNAPGEVGNYRCDIWGGLGRSGFGFSRAEDILVIREGQCGGRVGRSGGLGWGRELGAPSWAAPYTAGLGACRRVGGDGSTGPASV